MFKSTQIQIFEFTILDFQILKILISVKLKYPKFSISGVRRLATSYMNDPVTVFIGSLDLAAVHSVTQKIIMIGDEGETGKESLQRYQN